MKRGKWGEERGDGGIGRGIERGNGRGRRGCEGI